MDKHAVIITGGKQYLVKSNDVIIVDKVDVEKGLSLDLPVLLKFTEDGSVYTVTDPKKEVIKATVIDHVRGDKIRVAKFKAKVRYRKVRGYRASLSKLQISVV
ncbi:MAG: 50S ribosomal protein L21 [Candidatus Roizmanbacteria bacterium]